MVMPPPRAAPVVLARRGELIVERDPSRPSGRLLLQAGMDASYVDLGDPTHLEFDYMRWMRIVLHAARARRVLHIGGGACALARALAAEDPDGRHEVCEVDGDVLAFSREHLGLRRMPGLRVRHAEGREHVDAQPDGSWDALVIDAFTGALVPRHLITEQALGQSARVAPLTLVNVVDDRAARDVRAVAAGLRTAYPQVWALGRRVGNTVVVGARVSMALDAVAARVAADRSPAALIRPAALARLVAGTPALRDEEL